MKLENPDTVRVKELPDTWEVNKQLNLHYLGLRRLDMQEWTIAEFRKAQALDDKLRLKAMYPHLNGVLPHIDLWDGKDEYA